MRIASLLVLCLPLAACMQTGEEPVIPAAAIAPSAIAAPAPASRAGGGTGARGGAATATVQAAPAEVGPDILMQARAGCWMKVEEQKRLRGNIDQRSAFVDKCVADAIKSNPSP